MSKNCSTFIIFDNIEIHSIGLEELIRKDHINSTIIKLNNHDMLIKPDCFFPTEGSIILYHLQPRMYEQKSRMSFKWLKKAYPGIPILLYSSEYTKRLNLLLSDKRVAGCFLLSDKEDEISAIINSILSGRSSLSRKTLIGYLDKS